MTRRTLGIVFALIVGSAALAPQARSEDAPAQGRELKPFRMDDAITSDMSSAKALAALGTLSAAGWSIPTGRGTVGKIATKVLPKVTIGVSAIAALRLVSAVTHIVRSTNDPRENYCGTADAPCEKPAVYQLLWTSAAHDAYADRLAQEAAQQSASTPAPAAAAGPGR